MLGATEPPDCRLGGHLRAPRSFRPIAKVMRKPLADDRVRHFATPSSREWVGDAGVVGSDNDGRVVCHGRERQRGPTLTIASTIHATYAGRSLQRIALVGGPRLVEAARAASRALASRARQHSHGSFDSPQQASHADPVRQARLPPSGAAIIGPGWDGFLRSSTSAHRGVSHGGDAAVAERRPRPSESLSLLFYVACASALLGSRYR